MRRIVVALGRFAALAAVAGVAVAYWRRHPRIGTHLMNAIVNPLLLRRGLAGGHRSEIGTIEHVGRKTGIRRLTPVHPERTPEGFRIIVPLGSHSEWARNVVNAGHCRLQVHETVYELDEPALVPASEVPELPAVAQTMLGALGFEYLKLRTFNASQGSLEPAEPAIAPPAAPEPAAPLAPVAG